MLRPTIAVGLIVPLLCACERTAEPQAKATTDTPSPAAAPAAQTGDAAPRLARHSYRHQTGLDVAGYLMPTGVYGPAPWRLQAVALGSEAEFSQWELDGGGEFAPVMLIFEDTSSPKATNELGQENHTVTIRVFPTAYAIGPEEIVFVGEDATLGAVTLWGTLDPAVLARARKGGSSGDDRVLTGSLEVGQDRVRNAGFTWFRGD